MTSKTTNAVEPISIERLKKLRPIANISLDELKNLLNERVQKGKNTLVLNSDLLEKAGELVQHLHLDRLSITNAQVNTTFSDRVEVSGIATILNVKQSVTLVGKVDSQNGVELVLFAVPGDKWQIRDSFKALPDYIGVVSGKLSLGYKPSFFYDEGLTFANPTFVIATYNGTDNERGISFVRGLNYNQKSFKINNQLPFDNLFNYLNARESFQTTLQGTIDLTVINHPIFCLKAPLKSTIENRKITNLYLSLDTQAEQETSPYQSRIQICGTIKIGNASALISANLLQGDFSWSWNVDFSDKKLSLANVAEFAEVDESTFQLPKGMKGQSFYLSSLGIGFNPIQQKLTHFSCLFGSDTTWSTGIPKLTVSNLFANWLVLLNGKESTVSGSVGGTINVSSTAQLEVSAELPDFNLQANLVYGNTLSINDFIQYFTDIKLSGPQLDINQFSLAAYLGQPSSYSGSANIETHWVIIPEIVELESVMISLVYDEQNTPKPDYHISAQLFFGTTGFFVKIDTQNWKFTGEAQSDQSLKLGDFISSVVNKEIPIDALPQVLSDLTIKNLKVAVETIGKTNSKVLSFTCEVPNIINITLVFFKLDSDKPYQFFALLDIEDITLLDQSKIPAELQKMIGHLQVSLDQLKLIYTTHIPDNETIDILNHFDIKLPDGINFTDIKGNLNLLANLQINDEKKLPLLLSLATEKKSPSVEPFPSFSIEDSSPAPSSVKWIPIQKSIGPMHLDKIGLQYDNGNMDLLLDISCTLAGLTVDLDNFTLAFDLKGLLGGEISVKPSLQGLGVSYKNSALTIGGGFLGTIDPLNFLGTATLQTTEFSLSAVGQYAQINQNASLFIFAEASYAFGGPPFFFVTGLAGGFGYNSNLRLPGQSEVENFPFLSWLESGTIPTDPRDALNKLNNWVTPVEGNIWMGVGVRATTFELLQTSALLTARFGNDFILALLGILQARFPKEGELIFANIVLELEALFAPEDGVMFFSALLANGSFVIDPACHLQGGFAMFFWFGKNEHAGDFVITLGGYHPHFKPPLWYPQEPRLGFNWSLDAHVSIQGDAYFALTPSAIMAGGALHIDYHAGNLAAWLDAHADMIVWWNPFHFIADMGINIGTSYKVDLWFTSFTLTADLGADLTLWGPPTGGIVTVHWYVISFTVNFGAPPTNSDSVQNWSQFSKVLPDQKSYLKMIPLKGLISPKGNSQPPSTAPWNILSSRFQMRISSTIIASELYVDKATRSGTPWNKNGDNISIKPMQQKTSSYQCLYVTKDGESFSLEANKWDIQIETSSVPSALWGSGNSTQLVAGKDQLIADQYIGFLLTAPPATLTEKRGPIDITKTYTYTPIEPEGKNPLDQNSSPSGPKAAISSQTVSKIGSIADDTVSTNRNRIYTALKTTSLSVGKNDSLKNFAKASKEGDIFDEDPLLLAGEEVI